MTRCCLFLLVLVLVIRTAESRIRLPNLFQSGMILQRDGEGALVWGRSSCSRVYASVDGGERTTAIVQRKTFVIRLKPQPAGWGRTIVLEDCSSARRGGRITLTDVNFGDVFLCSGQSNMELAVWNDVEGPDAVTRSSFIGDGIRMFTGKRKKSPKLGNSMFGVPMRRKGGWLKSEPQSFGRKSGLTSSWPSALCFYTVRDLFWYYKREIPMGFIDSSIGGSEIEMFSSPEALEDNTCGGLARIPSASPTTEVRTSCQSCIWNGQIAPLTMFRFRAVLWYQGEANAKDPEMYGCRFPAMISDWRRKFESPDLTFVFVLLAGFARTRTAFTDLRQGQLRALELRKVGVASALDHGDPADIHPKNKLPVARRAALELIRISYGEDEGPSTPSVAFRSRTSTTITLTVNGISDGGVLQLAPTDHCDVCCQESPFQVFDGTNWRRARIVSISNLQVVLDVGSRPTRILNFNYENFPQCTLGAKYEDWGVMLPVLPFTRAL